MLSYVSVVVSSLGLVSTEHYCLGAYAASLISEPDIYISTSTAADSDGPDLTGILVPPKHPDCLVYMDTSYEALCHCQLVNCQPGALRRI
ncbi:hypothetical protein BJX61DRAFT_517800, partial [Aspergillus egyptiacus]